MVSFIRSISVAIILIGLAAGCQMTDENPQPAPVDQRRSPIVISALNHGDTYIKVVYGQPYKQGRQIFGGLEPFGTVWRTGANEATEITFTEDVEMAGYPVEAGTYALFTIPNPENWTVILNNDLGQWGAFTYNSEYDYLRFQVPALQTEEIIEALTIIFEEPDSMNNNGNTMSQDSTILSIAWDDTRIEIPITFLQ